MLYLLHAVNKPFSLSALYTTRHIQKMGKEVKGHCARIFALLDPDGRGKISRNQVAKAVRLLNWNPTDQEIQQLLYGYDNREFTYDEFVSMIDKRLPNYTVQQKKEDLRLALTVFDTSNSGWLDKDTFLGILTKCGQMPLDAGEIRTWVDRLDSRKDGRIRIAELEELFVSDEDVVCASTNQQWDMV